MAQAPTSNKKKGISAKIIVFSFLAVGFLIYCAIHEVDRRTYSIYNRNWGFDNFQFYESLTQYLLLFICLVLLIPYSNGFIQVGINKLAHITEPLKKRKTLSFILLSVLSVGIFYLLQVKYCFLGDFNLRLIQTMKQEWVNTEYATMRFLYVFAKAGEKAGASAEQMFKLYSYLAGGLYVFFSFLIADISGNNTVQKIFIFFSQLATAMMLIFCGYVEIYATPALLLHVYTYYGLCYLRGKHTIIWPVIALLLAIASHLLCLAAFPSLLVLMYLRQQDKFLFIRRQKNAVIGLVIFAGIVVALVVLMNFGHTFILPWKHNLYPTFLSKIHLWELLNGEILASGLYFVFVFLLAFISVINRVKWSASEYFLLALTGGLFFLVFVSNLQRGSGDWDLMSFPAVSLNLLVMLLIFNIYRKNTSTMLYLATMITGLSALNSFLWVHINHTDRSIEKLRVMLTRDPASYYQARISGSVQLALCYKNNKLFKQSEEVSLLTCREAPPQDVRACVMYAMRLKESGRIEETRVFFEDILQNRNPFVIEAYLFILKYYQDRKNPERMQFYLHKLYESFKENPTPFINNINFRKESLIEIFKVYYKYEEPKRDSTKLAEIQSMIEAIREIKRPPVK